MNKQFTARLTEGCTAYGFDVNGKPWNCEDKRYELTKEEKEEFIEALFKKIRSDMDNHHLNIEQLIQVLQSDRDHYDDHIFLYNY